MRWHVDGDSYKQDELDVINKGISLVDVPVKCIARGDVKEILCNKLPLYEGDDIVGLIGYFDNDDERLARM